MKVTSAEMENEVVPAEETAGKRKRGRRHGHVTVFGNWCKGCGLCVAFCPQQVFEIGADGLPVVAHEERCNACNWCYNHCPDFAVWVEEIGDVAGDDEAKS